MLSSVKRDRGSTFMLTCDISGIASVLFADVNFTQVHTVTYKNYATVEIHPYCLLRVLSDYIAHTSSRNFTIQVRLPVYIPKTELYIEHRTPDLRIGTVNIVVIRQGNRRENILHICSVLRQYITPNEETLSLSATW